MNAAWARLITGASIFAIGLLVGSGAAGNHGREPVVGSVRGHRLEARIAGNQCLIDAWANGSRVPAMLLDTGAYENIYLPAEIARNTLHIELAQLTRDHSYETWLGKTVGGATVRLDTFRVGDITLSDIPAFIDDTPLQQPLIGMGVLKHRLHAQLDTDTCVLTW